MCASDYVVALVMFTDDFLPGPGKNLALRYLSIVCATSLVMLDISKATDDSGAVLEPTCEMIDKVIK